MCLHCFVCFIYDGLALLHQQTKNTKPAPKMYKKYSVTPSRRVVYMVLVGAVSLPPGWIWPCKICCVAADDDKRACCVFCVVVLSRGVLYLCMLRTLATHTHTPNRTDDRVRRVRMTRNAGNPSSWPLQIEN